MFDTQADPWELTNLAADANYSKIKLRLKREMFSWMKQQRDFLTEDDEIPFLASKHPVDQTGKNYTCPAGLIGTVKQFVDPHELTE